jgi:hypothetical protein
MLIPLLRHALAEIDMDPAFIYQSTLHFEVSLHTLLLGLEFNKCILQTISCLPIFYDFTAFNLSKAAENQL